MVHRHVTRLVFCAKLIMALCRGHAVFGSCGVSSVVLTGQEPGQIFSLIAMVFVVPLAH